DLRAQVEARGGGVCRYPIATLPGRHRFPEITVFGSQAHPLTMAALLGRKRRQDTSQGPDLFSRRTPTFSRRTHCAFQLAETTRRGGQFRRAVPSAFGAVF